MLKKKEKKKAKKMFRKKILDIFLVILAIQIIKKLF